MEQNHWEALLKEYGEVSSNFCLLTDIRFKLLAFLPIATAAAAALKGESHGVPSLVLALFGLAATIGLAQRKRRQTAGRPAKSGESHYSSGRIGKFATSLAARRRRDYDNRSRT
jgi:hypothetical protein